MSVYIVIGVMALMTIAFVSGKWPFGLVTMTCCVILGLTGVLSPSEAFAGFCNKNLILLAGAFIVSDAFGKTSLIAKMQHRIIKMQNGKTGTVLMIAFVMILILLSCFLPSPATLAIIIVAVTSMSDDADVCPARIILPMAALSTMWTARLPIGVGATSFTRYNAFIESYGPEYQQYQLSMLDPLKGMILPLIVCSIYVVVMFRLLPKRPMNRSQNVKVKEQTVTMDRTHEIITYIVFAIVMLCMMLNKFVGSLMYIIPAAGAIVLLFTKTLSVEDAKRTLSGDLIFMLAGIYVLSDAMSSSGAGQVIGDFILSLMGGANSKLALIMVFSGVTLIVTNLMSNVATYNVMVPLAVSTAIAAGINPAALALSAGLASSCACMLPCSSGESAMCYAASGYSMKDTFKFTIGFVLLFWVSLVIDIMVFF